MQGTEGVPAGLTEGERTIRQAEKDRLAAKYGFASWNDAQDAALWEYQGFILGRAT